MRRAAYHRRVAPTDFVAGVDLGATNLRIAIAGLDGEIVARRAGRADLRRPPEDALRGIRREVDDLLRGVWPGAKLRAIGMGLPGIVDPGTGTVASPANLPGWGAVPVARLLSGDDGVPVAVENDANIAAIGERWRGAAKSWRTFVFVALGTGIGAGVVVDGRLHRGAHFFAGELAYLPTDRAHVRGPFEADAGLEGEAGGRAIGPRLSRMLGRDVTTEEAFRLAREGDPAAAAVIRDVQEHLAVALSAVAAILDPDGIVVGGGMSSQGEFLLGPVREMLHRQVPTKPPLVVSELGEDAQLLGAIRAALDRCGD
ncbi:MAG TPA: ROK family protein [Dehalococcoidia bacterium]|nr:ROK family protein [Dehalococcoidia bacterium]